MSKKSAAIKLSGKGLTFGIVASRFNSTIVDELLRHATLELKVLGVAADNIHIARVPGALELPIALEFMAASGRFDALIALGCVIRGKTFHFEIVSTQSAHGILMVQLKHHLPVANAVLTTESVKQAKNRCAIKGREAAQVAVEMANLKLQFASSLLRKSRTKK